MSGRLFLVCGLPGAGKTTLARELESRHAVELHALEVAFEERWRRLEKRNRNDRRLVITRAQLAGWESFWDPVTDAERAAYDAPLG